MVEVLVGVIAGIILVVLIIAFVCYRYGHQVNSCAQGKWGLMRVGKVSSQICLHSLHGLIRDDILRTVFSL
ncbi:hypothetical protein DPMN_177129 [Dreissena polymorpha]|uniref:Uncharacterized protein n=1 Tax=Dreissena polymorpha TaxID=45954 RepID=A0A9D4EB71_DREPO|nr:hypothetical protein DPMN_177129 [Dreissena polymorpha]